MREESKERDHDMEATAKATEKATAKRHWESHHQSHCQATVRANTKCHSQLINHRRFKWTQWSQQSHESIDGDDNTEDRKEVEALRKKGWEAICSLRCYPTRYWMRSLITLIPPRKAWPATTGGGTVLAWNDTLHWLIVAAQAIVSQNTTGGAI